ncbi:MAG: DUF5606 domain-containing protein [Brumimicrobium sp.]|nr:DUF5606 domain-containing protein [Brumimicrobium sp.]
MDLTGIISISGKTGLFKVIARSKNNIIVESLDDGKRIPAYSTDRISALEDISIYTYEEDMPLLDVYTKIAEKEACKAILSHKESANKLGQYLETVLPNYDKERVYPSDIKKLVQWYNILQKSGLITLEEKKAEKKEKAAKTEESDKKAPAKEKAEKATKPAAKKAPAKAAKPSAKSAAKPSAKTTAKPSAKSAAPAKKINKSTSRGK